MTGGERLSFDDVQILRLESPAIRGHTGKLAIVDAGEDGAGVSVDELRARIARRIEQQPRLRQRVVIPTGSSGFPRWEDDPSFDLADHVVSVGEEPLDEAGLRAAVGGLMSLRLDHERPLWRLDTVPLEGGRTAVFVRIHHCMADGVTGMRMLSDFLWDAPGGGSAPRGPSAPLPGGARRSSAEGSPGGRGLRTLLRLPGTVWRELRPGASSPLDRHIGGSREVAWTSFPLQELKRIEHGAGEEVTVNDVVLAAVSGALREWLHEEGVAPSSLKAQIPVSLHSRDERAGEAANRDSFLFVDLPLGEPDPVRRLRLINTETRERKLGHDAETLYSFFHSLARFGPLYREVTRLASGPREFALSVSNVPGPRDPAFLLDRPVISFNSFAEPADRHALRITVVSLGGVVGFGFCSDPEAVSSIDRIAGALRDSVAALEPQA